MPAYRSKKRGVTVQTTVTKFPKPGMVSVPPRPRNPGGAGMGGGNKGLRVGQYLSDEFKAAHRSEWDAMSHKERMAMRARLAPKARRRRRGTSV